jgi:hypothetical protein
VEVTNRTRDKTPDRLWGSESMNFGVLEDEAESPKSWKEWRNNVNIY